MNPETEKIIDGESSQEDTSQTGIPLEELKAFVVTDADNRIIAHDAYRTTGDGKFQDFGGPEFEVARAKKAQEATEALEKAMTEKKSSSNYVPGAYLGDAVIRTKLRYANIFWSSEAGYNVRSVKGNRMTYTHREWASIRDAVAQMQRENYCAKGELVTAVDKKYQLYAFSRWTEEPIPDDLTSTRPRKTDIRICGSWYDVDQKAYYFVNHLRGNSNIDGTGWTIDLDERLPYHHVCISCCDEDCEMLEEEHMLADNDE
jgi:hypothetical protein